MYSIYIYFALKLSSVDPVSCLSPFNLLLTLTRLFLLIPGCSLRRFDLCGPHSSNLPVLGSLRPLPADQPDLPRHGAIAATLPQLHLPRTGPLQHHQGRHHHHSGSVCRLLGGILGERAARTDVRARRDTACTPTSNDRTGGGARGLQISAGGGCTGGNSADHEKVESTNAIFMVQGTKK